MVFMSGEAFRIDTLAPGETARALAFYADYGPVDVAFMQEGMASGMLTVVLAADAGGDIAGFYLNRQPKYDLYRRLGLPEMQDLRVAESRRRQGLGETLVRAAESLVRGAGHKGLGISVGLHAGFGAAQRLYARLGYIPDGQGVTYDRQVVPEGEKRPVDADLTLMLMKFF